MLWTQKHKKHNSAFKEFMVFLKRQFTQEVVIKDDIIQCSAKLCDINCKCSRDVKMARQMQLYE